LKGLIHGNHGNQDKEILTVKEAGLSDEVGELHGVEDSTTVIVLDGVEGSTTVAVVYGVEDSTTVMALDGVEGMTYGSGSTHKSTTKSTMKHKTTMILSKPSMRKLDLKHLRIDLRNFTLITHLPQPGFESSYSHPNRGRRRRRRDAGESHRRAPHHCQCTSSSHDFESTKGKSSIGGNGGFGFRSES
jgi:hypothetical protein